MTMVGPQRHAMEKENGSGPEILKTPLPTLPDEENSLDSGYYMHKKSLGEGGFGKVRLGTHLKTNQKVAVKMMNKEKLGQDLQRVRIEIEALKVLQHDNIAKLLQVIETKTEIYLILEYCSGGELFDYLISKKRLTESEVRVIIKDLFQVLMYIHNRGFAHRDLKPENILFDDQHRIKLIDFGLAANSSKNKASLAFLSTCCGSPAYAAPELLRGQTYSGPAVDVWSAGVLLYSLLVGQLPFDDDNINNLYKKIQVGRFTMPQFLSPEVKDLIGCMLRVNPAERISVPKVLDHRWTRKGGPSQQQLNLLKSPPNVLDVDAFTCCQLLFPQLTKDQLLAKIKDFGYHTASYLLLKNNPNACKLIKETNQPKNLLQQQRNMFTAGGIPTSLNSPRIAAIKRKLQLDCDSNNTPVKRNAPATPRIQYLTPPCRPRGVPVKPVTPVTPRVPPRASIKSPAVAKNPPVRLSEKAARRIVSPKMRTTTKPNNENKEQATPKKNSTPQKQTPGGIKSPLREINNHPQTPVAKIKTLIKADSSSKKSLLKRLMASATPAKSHTPRKLTNSTHSNNITMTSFKDPQECINRLLHTLRAKGVDCKQKDFSLKCHYSSKIHSPLKFDLEICQYNGLCVIHRKRLKGDAWNYKKICELILQISNEQQVAMLAAAKEATTAAAAAAELQLTPLKTLTTNV